MFNLCYFFCDEFNFGFDLKMFIVIDELILDIIKEKNIIIVINIYDMNLVMEIGENIILFY